MYTRSIATKMKETMTGATKIASVVIVTTRNMAANKVTALFTGLGH